MEYCNIKEIHENLKKRLISVEELVDLKFDLIKKNEKNLNVFITEDYDNAIEKARELDEKNVFKGNVNILTGMPYGVKDNILTKGVLTTGGSRLYEHYIPETDATVVEKMNNLDAISLGKVNLDELGVGAETISHKCQTHNPYNLDFDANGSSGGSAVFVSAGYGPFAFASDTGGSVREPAGCCGVVGFKPTYGFIPTNGVMHYAKTLDHVGIIANSVTDVMIVTSAASKKFSTHTEFNYTDFECFEKELVPDICTIKVGYFKEIFESNTNEEYAAVWEFLRTIKKNKRIELVPLSLPEIYETRKIYSVKTAIEGYSEFTSHTDDISVYGERIQAKIKQGKELLNDKTTLRRLHKFENDIIRKYNRFFDNVHIIITPLSSFNKDINLITLANITKTPAIALPLQLGSNGVPLGLQVCGPIYDDRKLLRRAKYIEDLIGYNHEPTKVIK